MRSSKGRLCAELGEHGVDHLARVAEEHLRVVLVEQRVFDAGVAARHPALEHDAGLRFPDFEDGHAVDRARRIVERAGIDDVVGADHDRDIGLGEVVIDLFHLDHDVVRHARFGEQHVHVTGQPSGDRMDGEADVDAALAQQLGDVEHRILRLRDGHAVAGDDDDALGACSSSCAVSAARDAAGPRRPGAAPPAGAAPSSAPKPPRMTLRNERFIAAHMM